MSFPEEQLPREFGKYHLIERVATGGMAELFRAKLYGAGGFEKDLAVKKILPQLSQDADFIQMFMDEAMITVTLNHGNIAQVLDFGEIDGEYFLVMEYVDGVDLQNLLKRITEKDEPIPTEIAAYIVQEICKGLDYAHHKLGPDGQPLNIVHRDVSPQNVIISFEGQVKLVDFGIARAASRITSTQAGVVKGKMDYMSPEQLLGKKVDAQSDVWAAGVILYELLTLQKPFSGQTPQETMAAITRNVYKPPQKLNRQVSRKLSSVLKKALEGNVKKRYQTAGKMAQSLASYLHSTGRPPSPLALAQLLRERLPYEKPRTLNPTPVELKHRQEHQRSQPPVTPLPQTPPRSEEPSFASAPEPQKTPRSTAPEFPNTNPAPAKEESTNQASESSNTALPESDPSPVTEATEAISFSDLGLPGQYNKGTSPTADQAAQQNKESLDFDDETIVQPTMIDQDDVAAVETPAPASSKHHSDVQQEPIAELAQAAAKILSDAPLLDMPSHARTQDDPQKPSQSEDDSLVSYDDDLLAAPTILRQKAEVFNEEVNDNSSDESQPGKTPGPDSYVPSPGTAMNAMDEDQWMEHTPQNKADFYDEAPRRPQRQRGAMKAVFFFAMVLVVSGLVGGFIWNPFSTKRPEDIKKPLNVHKAANTPKDQPQSPVSDKDKATSDNKVPSHTPLPTQERKTPSIDAHAPKRNPGPLSKTVQHKKHNLKNNPTKHNPARHKNTAHKYAKAKGIGTLKINSEPFSVVYWNGKRMGPTPQMNIKLPSGSHTLELKNEALGLSRRVRVRIVANKVQTVFVELRR